MQNSHFTGYAHTFLNADQGRYAGHLIQALEFSECPVPAQLRILWEEYVSARKAEGKDVSTDVVECRLHLSLMACCNLLVRLFLPKEIHTGANSLTRCPLY